MVGIVDITNVTIENITSIMNISEPTDFFVNVNNTVYGEWLFFILLFTLWIILFMVGQDINDQILNNLMYSGAIVTILSLLLRGIAIVRLGIVQGLLLTDHQMWIFPLITIILAMVVWGTKED